LEPLIRSSFKTHPPFEYGITTFLEMRISKKARHLEIHSAFQEMTCPAACFFGLIETAGMPEDSIQPHHAAQLRHADMQGWRLFFFVVSVCPTVLQTSP